MAVMCACFICLMGMMLALNYNENIYDFLPMSGKDKKAITLYQDISGGQQVIAMVRMQDRDSVNTDVVEEAVDTFASDLQNGNGKKYIKDVVSQVDFDKYMSINDFVYANIPLMLADTDYQKMEEKLSSPGYIDEQLDADVKQIVIPSTGFFGNSISKDPLSLFAPVMQRLQSQQSSLPFEIDNGYIFTQGQKYAIVMIPSPYGAMESANNKQLVDFVDSVAQITMSKIPGIAIETTGSPVIAVGNANQIKSDSLWAITVAVTLIIILLAFSFRLVKNILLIGFAIFFGWAFAMGLISVVRNDVSLIVLGIGSIIIGIAVNYPLHFIAHTDHGGTIRDVLKEMIAPLLIGNITTVGAFACLMPLDAPALRDLGLFAAFMLVGTILFVLIFLPHLVKARYSQKERLPFGKITAMSPEHHRWVLWIILILTCVFSYFSLETSFDANMHHVNYMNERQQTLLADLHASAGISDTSNVYIVTEGNDWNQAIAEREKLSKSLDTLRCSGKINSYSDASRFICSAEEQQKRIERWNVFWEEHRHEVLAELSAKSPAYGFSVDAFNDFKEIVSKEYAVKQFEHFEPMRSVLLSHSFSNSTGNCSVVDVIDVKGKNISQVEDALSKIVGDKGYVFDFVGMNSSVANSLSNNFNYIGFACGFIVFIFLWMSFGRLELSVLAFMPMALGWIWILGIMNLLGMQFNIVNVILATFIFGQGDDYTIFMTDGLINEFAYRKKLLPSYKNSIIISALIMFIGMGSLIIAKHPALHSLAEVTIVGMLTVVMMAWIVPPLIFNWLVKTNKSTRRVPVTSEQIIRTMYCSASYIVELAYGCISGGIIKMFSWNGVSKSCEEWFHRLIYKSMVINVNHIWGVKYNIHNKHGENFSKGSILISNHQSILDPVCMLALNPHVLILISEKVWNHPIVHPLFKLAGFINLNQPIETLKEKIGDAVNKGYNVVIFPEGQRNDERITRFHKGAFYLAQGIDCDILPVMIHGAGHVMPKGSGFASRGQIDIEIGKRISAIDLATYGNTHQSIANKIHKQYLERYEMMRSNIENTHYFHDYVIGKYIYKGVGIEKETRHLLRKYDDFSKWIDNNVMSDSMQTIAVINAGHGQFSLMLALTHPELEIHSYAKESDDAELLASCEPLPANLYVHVGEADLPSYQGQVIDFSKIVSE